MEEVRSTRWYENMPNLPEHRLGVVCDPDIRRKKCDSLYIRLNTQLKKRMIKAVKLIDKDTNDSAKDLKIALKQILDVNFEDDNI